MEFSGFLDSCPLPLIYPAGGHYWKASGSFIFIPTPHTSVYIENILLKRLFSSLSDCSSFSLFIGQMLQSHSHLCGPVLNSLQHICIFQIAGSPEWDTAFHLQPHRCVGKMWDRFPWPVGNIPPSEAEWPVVPWTLLPALVADRSDVCCLPVFRNLSQ